MLLSILNGAKVFLEIVISSGLQYSYLGIAFYAMTGAIKYAAI